MALPIAHAAAGYLVHRTGRRESPASPWRRESPASPWRRAALFMLVANLPDFDFVFGFVMGRPGLVHRGVSHTVLAAVAFGVLAGLAARRWWREPFLPSALALGAAYASHLVVDWLTIDSRPPAGGQFLWPFSEAYYVAPVTIFGEIWIDGVTRAGFLGTVLAWQTVVELARELVVVLVVVAIVSGFTAVRRFGAAATLRFEGEGEDLA